LRAAPQGESWSLVMCLLLHWMRAAQDAVMSSTVHMFWHGDLLVSVCVVEGVAICVVDVCVVDACVVDVCVVDACVVDVCISVEVLVPVSVLVVPVSVVEVAVCVVVMVVVTVEVLVTDVVVLLCVKVVVDVMVVGQPFA